MNNTLRRFSILKFSPQTFFIFIFTLCYFAVNAQYSIKFKSPNYKDSLLLVGYYYGDKQLVKDSLFRNKEGFYEMTGKDTLRNGLYMAVLKPNNTPFQFLVQDEKNFTVTFDTSNLARPVFKGSVENDLFYDFIAYISQKRKEADPLKAKIEAAEKDSTKTVDVSKEKEALDKLDKEVKAYQQKVYEQYPKSLTTFILKGSNDIEVPKFEEETDEKAAQLKKYYYYRSHFFDNIDMKNPSLIYNNFFYNKVNDYFTKLVPQAPDSLIMETDLFMQKIKGNEDAERFFLSQWIQQYGNGKFIGTDALFVHLIDHYFKAGKTPWADPEKMEKLYRYADDWRPILIGKTIPNIALYKEDSTLIQLHQVKADYTLLVFWAPDCGHCKKAMPFIVDWEEKHRNDNIKIVSVCTFAYDKEPQCWPGVKEKKMENFINTSDKDQAYRRYISVPSTPKVFLLDKNKKILIKDFSAEKIDEVFEEVLKTENAMKTAKS